MESAYPMNDRSADGERRAVQQIISSVAHAAGLEVVELVPSDGIETDLTAKQ